MAGAQFPDPKYVCFEMDNVMAVQCVQWQGIARLSPLLALSKDIFVRASQRLPYLLAKYVPGLEERVVFKSL